MQTLIIDAEETILELVNEIYAETTTIDEAKSETEAIAKSINENNWEVIKAKLDDIIDNCNEFTYSDLQGVVMALVMNA